MEQHRIPSDVADKARNVKSKMGFSSIGDAIRHMCGMTDESEEMDEDTPTEDETVETQEVPESQIYRTWTPETAREYENTWSDVQPVDMQFHEGYGYLAFDDGTVKQIDTATGSVNWTVDLSGDND